MAFAAFLMRLAERWTTRKMGLVYLGVAAIYSLILLGLIPGLEGGYMIAGLCGGGAFTIATEDIVSKRREQRAQDTGDAP